MLLCTLPQKANDTKPPLINSEFDHSGTSSRGGNFIYIYFKNTPSGVKKRKTRSGKAGKNVRENKTAVLRKEKG